MIEVPPPLSFLAGLGKGSRTLQSLHVAPPQTHPSLSHNYSPTFHLKRAWPCGLRAHVLGISRPADIRASSGFCGPAGHTWPHVIVCNGLDREIYLCVKISLSWRHLSIFPCLSGLKNLWKWFAFFFSWGGGGDDTLLTWLKKLKMKTERLE